jgi:hypothetical protein
MGKDIIAEKHERKTNTGLAKMFEIAKYFR